MKLLKVAMTSFKLMDTLVIGTKYDVTIAAPRGPSKTANLFDTNSITDDQVNAHCDLVWSDSNYGANTPNYFKTFSTPPKDKNKLDALRNQSKIRQVMLGKKLWNIFTSKFQLNILP